MRSSIGSCWRWVCDGGSNRSPWASRRRRSRVPAPSPFVVCSHQRYALCASASCFVYNGVAYCQCDILKGNSISLQLDFSTPTGKEDVCDVNAQGRTNGYMISTYSLPSDAQKGGTAAVYTCPGADNAGSGVPAPVAYGQCDGGFCFTSTTGKEFPGFDRSGPREIICSCPISTDETKGSSNNLGYQVFGPYHPKAPVGEALRSARLLRLQRGESH